MNELITGPPGPGWLWNGTEWVCTPCQPPCMPPPPGPPPWYPPPEGQPPWYPGANGGVSFGQSPPPNPIRGAFWYNGQALFLFDGAVWVDVGVVGAGSGGGTSTGTQPPTNPVDGSLWFNGSTLYIWDGNAWVPTSATKTYIQSTAPPAPNAGDQWWNGAQMFIWDGAKWNAVGPGQSVGPVPTTTQVLSIAQTTDVAMTANTPMIVPFTVTPQTDVQAAYDPISKRITPTKAGMYAFMCRMFAANVGAIWVGVFKNDSGVAGTDQTTNVTVIQEGQGGNWLQGMGMTPMNGSTDYVRMWAYTGGTFHGSANPAFVAYLMP